MSTIDWDRVDRALERDGHRMIWKPYGLPEIADPVKSAFFEAPVTTPWPMPDAVAVSVAVTGALFTQNNNPQQPVETQEIARQAVECASAGASSVHLHVRDDRGYNVLSRDRFVEAVTAIRTAHPDVAVDGCLVAAMPGEWDEMKRTLEERILDAAPVNTAATYIGDALFAKPFPYVLKKTQLILESGTRPIIACYTDADINNADRMLFRSGLLKPGQHWLLLPALPGCSPMDSPRQMMAGLLHLTAAVMEVDPNAVVTVCAAGRASTFLATAALMLGLNVRVGMEDTVWYWPHREDLITDNIAHLRLTLCVAESLGLRVANHAEYRQIAGLPNRPAERVDR